MARLPSFNKPSRLAGCLRRMWSMARLARREEPGAEAVLVVELVARRAPNPVSWKGLRPVRGVLSGNEIAEQAMLVLFDQTVSSRDRERSNPRAISVSLAPSQFSK